MRKTLADTARKMHEDGMMSRVTYNRSMKCFKSGDPECMKKTSGHMMGLLKKKIADMGDMDKAPDENMRKYVNTMRKCFGEMDLGNDDDVREMKNEADFYSRKMRKLAVSEGKKLIAEEADLDFPEPVELKQSDKAPKVNVPKRKNTDAWDAKESGGEGDWKGFSGGSDKSGEGDWKGMRKNRKDVEPDEEGNVPADEVADELKDVKSSLDDVIDDLGGEDDTTDDEFKEFDASGVEIPDQVGEAILRKFKRTVDKVRATAKRDTERRINEERERGSAELVGIVEEKNDQIKLMKIELENFKKEQVQKVKLFLEGLKKDMVPVIRESIELDPQFSRDREIADSVRQIVGRSDGEATVLKSTVTKLNEEISTLRKRIGDRNAELVKIESERRTTNQLMEATLRVYTLTENLNADDRAAVLPVLKECKTATEVDKRFASIREAKKANRVNRIDESNVRPSRAKTEVVNTSGKKEDGRDSAEITRMKELAGVNKK